MRIALTLLLCLSGALDAATPDSPVRVSLVALPASGAAAPLTTGAPVFVPQEAERCVLQVTLENRGDTPVALASLIVSGGGVLSRDKKFTALAFNDDEVTAAAAETSGANVLLRLRYTRRVGAAPIAGRLAGLVGGENSTEYNWLSPDGVLMPGKAVSKTFPWIPLDPKGTLVLPVHAEIMYLPLGREPGKSFLVPAHGTAIPARPAWTLEEPGSWNTPDSDPFPVWFTPLKNWEPGVLVDGIVARSVATSGVKAEGANRITLNPGPRPLKSLLPQLNFQPGAVAYSQTLDAWFIATRDRTVVIQGQRRLELGQDVTDFITSRVLAGDDAAPWSVILDEDATALEVHLAGVPRERKRGAKHDSAKIPAAQIVDRLSQADRAKLLIRFNGDVVPRRD